MNLNIGCIETEVQEQKKYNVKGWTSTLDVLKQRFIFRWFTVSSDEPQHWMYWNEIYAAEYNKKNKMNLNIGCIETITFPFDLYAILSDEPQHWMYWNARMP